MELAKVGPFRSVTLGTQRTKGQECMSGSAVGNSFLRSLAVPSRQIKTIEDNKMLPGEYHAGYDPRDLISPRLRTCKHWFAGRTLDMPRTPKRRTRQASSPTPGASRPGWPCTERGHRKEGISAQDQQASKLPEGAHLRPLCSCQTGCQSVSVLVYAGLLKIWLYPTNEVVYDRPIQRLNMALHCRAMF